MPKYTVTVTRTTSRSAEFEVEADSPDQAADDVMNVSVGDHDFGNESESEPDYEVESVIEIEDYSPDLPAKVWGDLADSDDMVLDDLVHDLVSQQASAVNSEGTEGQVRFIILEMGQDDGVKAIKEALEWRNS